MSGAACVALERNQGLHTFAGRHKRARRRGVGATRPCLAIMVKAPIAGAVKTRLGREIGTVAATRFYRRNTAALLDRLGHDPRWRSWLAIAPDTALRAPFWPPHLPRIVQGPGDLGARMQRIFDLLAPAPTIIIGSDIPAIRPAHIAAAFAHLEGHDAILGAAGDGGYWLIGVRSAPHRPRPFSGVRWSGPHALADTRRNLQRAGHSVAVAAALRDVDEAADYTALAALAGRVILPPLPQTQNGSLAGTQR